MWLKSSIRLGVFAAAITAWLIVSPAPAALAQTPPAITAAAGSSEPEPLSALQEQALKPKDMFKECAKCPEMMVVPAGSFTMGSPPSEPQRSVDEGPQHTVRIDRPFAVGRFEVTFREWDACVTGGGCNRYKPSE